MARASIQMDHFAFAHCLHRSLQPVKARKIRGEGVAGHANDDEGQREPAQVDLMFQFAVNGHEHVEPAFGKAEERVVFTASPTGFAHGRNRMARKCGTHAGVNTFV